MQVDAHRDGFVVHDQRQRFAVLQPVYLRRAQVQVLGQHLQVAPDDGGRDGHHLFRPGVYLHEDLRMSPVFRQSVREDRLACEQLFLLLLIVAFQRRGLQCGVEKHVHLSVFHPVKGQTGTALCCLPVLVAHAHGQHGRVAAFAQFVQHVHRQIFDHLLRESEAGQRLKRQFVKFKSRYFHILIELKIILCKYKVLLFLQTIM